MLPALIIIIFPHTLSDEVNMGQRSNAQSYAFNSESKYIFESDQEEEWEFRGTEIIRTEKSMSAAVSKTPRNLKSMKKSNSFLASNPPKNSNKKKNTSHKKSQNNTLEIVHKKQPSHSKSSMNKTTLSIGNTSKSSFKGKQRSSSRDFIILDSNIYECHNIEEINEAMVCKDPSIFSHQRFCKSVMKKLTVLEVYVKGFSEQISLKSKTQIRLPITEMPQKKKLYDLLRKQTKFQTPQLKKQFSEDSVQFSFSKKHERQKSQIEGIVKFAAEKIEEEVQHLLKSKPNNKESIFQWKNQKLHQLLSAHTFLIENNNEGSTFFESEQKIKSMQSIQSALSKENICQGQYDQDNQDNQSNEREENHQLISNHYIEEKFPQTKEDSKSVKNQSSSLPQDHLFSQSGIELFMQKLWDYLVESGQASNLIASLLKPYGLSLEEKEELLNSQIPNTHYSTVIDSALMKDQVFINFHKQNKIEDLSKEEAKCLIVLQKAIFDCANQTLSQFQPEFPTGKLHPLEGKSDLSAFLIDQSNIFDVWDVLIKKVLEISSQCQGKSDQIISKSNNSVEIHDSFSYLFQRTVYEQLFYEIELSVFEEFAEELQRNKK